MFRAIETARADRLFADPLAVRFLSGRGRRVVALSRLPLVGGGVPSYIDRRMAGTYSNCVIRTRAIDDMVGDELAAGAEQLVILGAGLDARPYRLEGLDGVRVFEVDAPASQERKRAVLAGALGAEPAEVRFVPVDFAHDETGEALAAAGYDPSLRSVFVWEGVISYLTPEAVDETFRAIASSAPASCVIFTYLHRGVLDGSFEGAGALIAAVRRRGEQFTFGFDPAELPEYLRERGLEFVEDRSMADRAADYPGRNLACAPIYRLAAARIASPTQR